MKKQIKLIACAFVVFLAFFLLNHHTPRTMDDFNYAFKFTEEGWSNEKITSSTEIPKSQYYHYLKYNGRTLVHFLAQFFSIQKTNTHFNIFNSLAVVLLVTLLSVYAKVKTGNNKKPTILLLSFILFWFLIPSPSTTLMWKTGSLNYLWTSVLILSFLCVHHKASNGGYSSKKLAPLLFLFGIICGWGHEGISIGISIGLLAHHVYKRKNINLPLMFLVLGFWVGSALVIFSPGILARADNSIISSELFSFITKRVMAIYRMFFEGQTKATLITTLGILFFVFKNRTQLKEFIKKNSLIFFSFVSFLIFQILTAFPGQGRGAMGMELMAILILLIFIIDSKFSGRRPKIILIILFSLFVVDYSTALMSCINNNRSAQTLLRDYKNSTDGIVKSTFPNDFLNDRFIFYLYSSKFNYPQNVAISKFYDSEKPLIVLGEAFFNEIKTGQGLFQKANMLDEAPKFFTTPELDCYVSKLNNDSSYHHSVLVELIYGPKPFLPDALNSYLLPIMQKVSQHYSGTTQATTLVGKKHTYLIVPKSVIPKTIALKKIKLRQPERTQK